MKITEAEKTRLFNRGDYLWEERTITLDSELDELEKKTGLKIALAVKYIEMGKLISIKIVTTDRRHYNVDVRMP